MEKTFVLLLLTVYNDPATIIATVRGEDIEEAFNKVDGCIARHPRLAQQTNVIWTINLPGRSEAVRVSVSDKMVAVLEKLHPEGITHVFMHKLFTSKPADLVQDTRYAFYLCETPEIV